MNRTTAKLSEMFAALAGVTDHIEQELWEELAQLAKDSIGDMESLALAVYSWWESCPPDTEECLVLGVARVMVNNSK